MKVITIYCNKCYKKFKSTVESTVSCLKCDISYSTKQSKEMNETGIIDVCPICSCGYFYKERDFSAKIGMLVFVSSAALYLYYAEYIWSILFLVAAAVLDAIIYFSSGNRTICYQCLSEFRGFTDNPNHKSYELGIASRFSDLTDR